MRSLKIGEKSEWTNSDFVYFKWVISAAKRVLGGKKTKNKLRSPFFFFSKKKLKLARNFSKTVFDLVK